MIKMKKEIMKQGYEWETDKRKKEKNSVWKESQCIKGNCKNIMNERKRDVWNEGLYKGRKKVWKK